LHRLTDILRSDKKNCNWIVEKKNPENDLEPPNRLTQIKQVEAFKWIYDILRVQLQNLDLNNIEPEVDLGGDGGHEEGREAEISENKDAG
jgi:hypothetical protein